MLGNKIMRGKKYFKILLGIIGAILLGAIGSGVWKFLLEPAIFRGRNSILNIAVLGVEKYKNNIYEEVAKGFHEIPSLEVYYYVIWIFALGLIVYGTELYIKSKQLKWKHDKLLVEIKSIITGTKRKELSISELYDDASKIKPQRLVFTSKICIVVVIIFATWLFISHFRHRYINSAITHFQQMCSIVKPYIDQQQEKQIISEFAQIKNKQNYINVIVKLKQLAEKNNLEMPKFEPW